MTLIDSDLTLLPVRQTKALTTERFYTIGYAPQGAKPNPKPQLTLSGRWLEEFGFCRGKKVVVKIEQAQLIIQLVNQANA